MHTFTPTHEQTCTKNMLGIEAESLENEDTRLKMGYERTNRFGAKL